jgi:hypothetical protein
MSMIILQNMYILIPMNAAISPNLGPDWSTLSSHIILWLSKDMEQVQCSRLKPSMPFKRDFGPPKYSYLSQNNPSKRNPKLNKNKTTLEVLNIMCLPQEPTSVGYCHYKKWSQMVDS